MEKKAVVKNYIFLGIMLGAMVLGAIVGWLAPAKVVAFFKPFGTVFINMMFCVVVPLVFVSIAGSVANMKSMKRAVRSWAPRWRPSSSPVPSLLSSCSH